MIFQAEICLLPSHWRDQQLPDCGHEVEGGLISLLRIFRRTLVRSERVEDDDLDEKGPQHPKLSLRSLVKSTLQFSTYRLSYLLPVYVSM